jgi:hypothetical protein
VWVLTITNEMTGEVVRKRYPFRWMGALRAELETLDLEAAQVIAIRLDHNASRAVATAASSNVPFE